MWKLLLLLFLLEFINVDDFMYTVPDANLKWIVDLTIAYPNGEPLDIVTIFCASRPPCNVVFHYKCYSISEVTKKSFDALVGIIY